MRIEQMWFDAIDIPFTTAFTHAGAARSRAEGIWVIVRTREGAIGHGEGCPRVYVSGETITTAREFFHSHRFELMQEIHDLCSLRRWVEDNREHIDTNPAAWCAIELALLTAMAAEQGRPVETILGLPLLGGRYRYSAVIGDEDDTVFARQFARYRDAEFTDFKLKTRGRWLRDRHKIETLCKHDGGKLKVRLDANNTWRSAREAVAYLRALEYPFIAVEEPLRPDAYDDLERIGKALDTRIILDESILRLSQLQVLQHRPQTWIVNVRISKMGGLLRTIEITQRLKELGIPIIVGAHVGETSLLTRAALAAASAAGSDLLAQEGAFGTYLLTHDVCHSPIMFGEGGMLSVEDCLVPDAPGFGLSLRTEWATPREVAA